LRFAQGEAGASVFDAGLVENRVSAIASVTPGVKLKRRSNRPSGISQIFQFTLRAAG